MCVMKDDHTIDALKRVSERLRAAVGALVGALPPEARSISAMSRTLEVHKATCQRVVEGLSDKVEALEGLARLPGVAALKMHAAACERAGVPGQVVAEARAAIDEYATVLRRRGLTHEKVRRLVMVSRDRGEEGSLAQKRRKALFDAASLVSGERADAKAIAMVILPGPTPATTEICALVSMIQAEREPFARPMTLAALGAWWSHIPGLKPDGVLDEVRPPNFEVVQEISTAQVKAVELESSPGRAVVVIEAPTGAASDATILFKTRGTLGGAGAKSVAAAARVGMPVKTLVMDVMVHRSLEIMPSVTGCFALSAAPGDRPEGAPEQLWHERLADTPRVTEFDASRPPRCAVSVQEELVQRALGAAKVAPEDVRSFRLEIKYPIWQSEYRVYFGREVPGVQTLEPKGRMMAGR